MKFVLIGLAVLAGLAIALPFDAKSRVANDNPVVVAAAAPVYPEVAFHMKADGDVTVEVTINSVGDVVNAALVAGHALLKAPSLEAARRWKFQPTESSANRVVRLTFVYRPDYKGTKPKADRAPVFYPPYKSGGREENRCDLLTDAA